MDLRNPSLAYLFGFIQADGSLSEETRNRGRLSIELHSKDRSILQEFNQLIACSTLNEKDRRSKEMDP
ncbi:LAGLIDADG family homing endonuclease [Paenibacillus alkalitolerans]|uniref:LAGLIDADG family homing endonuclease n=1 Tax=Paenibacillus alkalitolerans TaxID=2799335 RepID=UPI0018F796A2|nr:LAGLIDADG family homing endonuclease [Paenibacillus alkalitolerans]